VATKRDDRDETRRAVAYSILYKMIRITSDFAVLRKNLDAMLDQKMDGEPWQRVLPLANLPAPVKFTAEEMSLVLSIDNAFFNDLVPIDEIHTSTIGLFAAYNSLRMELTDSFSPIMQGNVGQITLDYNAKCRLDAKGVELNMLITQMGQRAQQDAEQASTLLYKMPDIFNPKLGTTIKLKPKQETPKKKYEVVNHS